MENLLTLTLFGSVLIFCIVTIICFGLLILSDNQESGFFALFVIGVFVLLNQWKGNFDLLDLITFKNAFTYLISGFIFSTVRTFFKGRELTERENHDFDLKQHVFRWWFLFPICALNWVFGSLLKQAFDWFYAKIETFYQKLFNALDK